MLKHLCASPVDGCQRCARCDLILIDYPDAEDDPGGELLLLYFPVSTEVVHDEGFLGAATDAHAEVPRCIGGGRPQGFLRHFWGPLQAAPLVL